jgi:hypothetical protein
MFLFNLLPTKKQLSPLDNLYFTVEVHETLRRRPAAPEFQVIAYQSTSSASPSDYNINNSPINVADCGA